MIVIISAILCIASSSDNPIDGYIKTQEPDVLRVHGKAKHKVKPGVLLEIIGTTTCRVSTGICWKVRDVESGKVGWVNAIGMAARHDVITAKGEKIKILNDLFLSIPAKNLKSYTFKPTKSLAERVQPTPDFLINYLMKIDKRKDYTSYTISKAEGAIINGYLLKLPPLHRKILKKRLIGIYFVSNLIGSGWMDYVLSDNNDLYAIIIINPLTIGKSLSTWLTYRENTCFSNRSSQIRVEVDCGKEFSGLMYVLLHETTHIVDFILQYTPYVSPEMPKLNGFKVKYSGFVEGIWEGYRKPLKKYDFANRENLTFYGVNNGPKIDVTDAVMLYRQFANTPFVSLYGSQSWAEDFAELITFYHLTERLHQPFTINYYENEEKTFNYSPMKSAKIQNRINKIIRIYTENRQ
jgi:hypothetical protein